MRRRLLTYILLATIAVGNVFAQQPMRRRPMNTPNNMGVGGMMNQYGNQYNPNDPYNSNRQQSLGDSTHNELQGLPPKLYMWKIDEALGNRTIVPADTLALNFQNSNLTEGMYGHYNHTGNLGAARISRIFFDRKEAPTLFLNPLSDFIVRPQQFFFTNSNVPYTNLSYYKAGNAINGEEHFKSYFSVNVNKRLAFGFNFDYLYARGYYTNQAISDFNAGLFASYIGEKYQLQAIFNNYNMKMNENGGILDDRYITKPEEMAEGKKAYEPNNIPVRFERVTNHNRYFYIYLNQRYSLGFYKKIKQLAKKDEGKDSKSTAEAKSTNGNKPDSTKNDTITKKEFVPVTSFIYTTEFEQAKRKFNSESNLDKYYPHAYLQKNFTNDSTRAVTMKNFFGIELMEGFNKYAKAGLTAYISHRMNKYYLMNVKPNEAHPEITDTEHELFVGGKLAKRNGKFLHYDFTGETGLIDKSIGEFNLSGNLDFNFRLWKDTVNLYARAKFSNLLPSYYLRHYHSNYYSWDNDFDKTFTSRLEGELNINRWRTNLKFTAENLKNHVYIGQDGLPKQASDNIQVISAALRQNFKVGIFHLDNEAIWQKSSNNDILPLPDLSFYSNFYILTKVAKKVLNVQLGAEAIYYTKYYAPAYNPALQQFQLQADNDRVEIGGYPVVNVYANLQLKRTRIFAMLYHVNAGLGKENYFMAPHYPMNPSIFKFGLSWNFYD